MQVISSCCRGFRGGGSGVKRVRRFASYRSLGGFRLSENFLFWYSSAQADAFSALAEKGLPACFLYARDLALVSELTEADTADAVLAEISVGTAADLATVVLSGGELLLSLLLENH